jgi:hypothetical protein
MQSCESLDVWATENFANLAINIEQTYHFHGMAWGPFEQVTSTILDSIVTHKDHSM